MDLPDELTLAEQELKLVYAEYRALKEESAKTKEAEAAASKKRGHETIDDVANVVKKLKGAGLLEKLRADEAPKSQYKRASTLERRLSHRPDPPLESATVPSPMQSSSLEGKSFSAPVPASSVGDRNTQHQHGGSSGNNRPPRAPIYDTPRIPIRTKSLYDSFINSEDSPADSTDKPKERLPNTSSYNLSDRTPHKGLGYQDNGFRQKMIFVEAENVDETFLRPIFEKFGPLLRINTVPEKRHAFILYKFWNDSQTAIKEMDGKVLDGVNLKVSVATTQPERSTTNTGAKPWADKASQRPPPKPETRELVTYEEGELM